MAKNGHQAKAIEFSKSSLWVKERFTAYFYAF